MEKRIEAAADDEQRLELMNEFSFHYKSIYIEYTKELSIRALELARRVDSRRGVALALANKGIEMLDISRYQEALGYLEEAQLLLKSLPPGEQRGLHRTLNALGCIHMEQADYTKAAGYLREALNICDEKKDSLLIGKIYTNLSFIHVSLNQSEQAFEYCFKALDLLEKGDDYYSYILTLTNLGEAFQMEERFEEALSYLELALRTVEKYSIERLKGAVMYEIGTTYLKMREFRQAEHFLEAALNSESSRTLPFYLVHSLMGMGRLYLAKGLDTEGRGYLLRALKASEENEIINPQAAIYKELYESYREEKMAKEALSYLEQYSRLKESEHNLEMSKTIRNVETEYLKRANNRLHIISSIGRKITATLHMESLLDRIYRHINSLMDADIFGIASYDSISGRISYDKYIENGKHLSPTYSTVDNRGSFTSLAIRERRDILINDIISEAESYIDNSNPFVVGDCEEKENDEKRWAQSIMIVPLMVENEVTGAVTVHSYRKGAYNAVELDSLKILASYIAIALNNARQAALITCKNKELRRLSITDYLTGVYNRREFELRLGQLWRYSTNEGRALSILLIDADHFKSINDNYGHLVGDDCLKELAELIGRNIQGPFSCLARYGGEEFIVMLNCRDDEAQKKAEQIRAQVESEKIESEGQTISMTISIGVSCRLLSDIDTKRGPEQLISRADEALYISKVKGRNRVTYLPFGGE